MEAVTTEHAIGNEVEVVSVEHAIGKEGESVSVEHGSGHSVGLIPPALFT